MTWDTKNFKIKKVLSDDYFFAGSNWCNQVSKRYIVNVESCDKIIESSYYLHLKKDGTPFNVAFEPSTSFGCAVGCLFCASGSLFPIKQLSSDEICSQVVSLSKSFDNDFDNFKNIRKDVFYSGIGEPSLIMPTIIDASNKILELLPNISFKLSSMGASPRALVRLAKTEIPIRSLQIGIPHYDQDKIRNLYSKTPNYSLEKLFDSINGFATLKSGTVIKINYVVIKGYNDNKEVLRKTIEKVIARIGKNIDFKISCLNPTDFAKSNNLFAVNADILDDFSDIARGYDLSRVYTFGPMSEEKLGCGQLAGDYQQYKNYG